jgi:hypothetical protein
VIEENGGIKDAGVDPGVRHIEEAPFLLHMIPEVRREQALTQTWPDVRPLC